VIFSAGGRYTRLTRRDPDEDCRFGRWTAAVEVLQVTAVRGGAALPDWALEALEELLHHGREVPGLLPGDGGAIADIARSLSSGAAPRRWADIARLPEARAVVERDLHVDEAAMHGFYCGVRLAYRMWAPRRDPRLEELFLLADHAGLEDGAAAPRAAERLWERRLADWRTEPLTDFFGRRVEPSRWSRVRARRG